jgi:hypothetical protein
VVWVWAAEMKRASGRHVIAMKRGMKMSIYRASFFLALASMGCASTEADVGVGGEGGAASSAQGSESSVGGAVTADACGLPPEDPCPVGYQLHSASLWDPDEKCMAEATPFVCSRGAGAGSSCLVEERTGLIFVLEVTPCPPSGGYRACTTDEFTLADAKSCEQP